MKKNTQNIIRYNFSDIVLQKSFCSLQTQMFLNDGSRYHALNKIENEYLVAAFAGVKDKYDGNFTYKINKDGFRSDHFDKLDNRKTNFLYAGCSYTFGIGMPEDHLWPKMLEKKINNSDISGYNLGVPGIDTQQEILNIYKFISKYGKPDYILFAMPPIYRSPVFDSKHNEIFTEQANTNMSDIRDLELWLLKKENESIALSNILSIRSLEEYCSISNIKLITFTWDYSTEKFYSKIKLESFININTYKDYDFDKKYFLEKDLSQYNEKYFKWARDNHHAGTWLQIKIFDSVYNHMEKLDYV